MAHDPLRQRAYARVLGVQRAVRLLGETLAEFAPYSWPGRCYRHGRLFILTSALFHQTGKRGHLVSMAVYRPRLRRLLPSCRPG
jgi:hypothetical protein